MGVSGHLWGFVGDLVVLGVLVTYKLTRGTKFVVGRFTEGVKGGVREFWGGLGRSRGINGGLLHPYKSRFAPLEGL